jgi:hypothetical protein
VVSMAVENMTAAKSVSSAVQAGRSSNGRAEDGCVGVYGTARARCFTWAQCGDSVRGMQRQSPFGGLALSN